MERFLPVKDNHPMKRKKADPLAETGLLASTDNYSTVTVLVTTISLMK
jgi:hypothetical protein